MTTLCSDDETKSRYLGIVSLAQKSAQKFHGTK
jgi:hypothetical protein